MTARTVRPWLVATVLLSFSGAAAPALAGPPLLCHPFEIGDAASLPWDGRASWFDGRDDYEVSRLLADTTSLLTPDTPVIVRMETLRRAAIYASRSEAVAADLVSALTRRAVTKQRGGQADALAYLDAAYLIEALRQVGKLQYMPEFRAVTGPIGAVVKDVDGYGMMKKSLMLSPGDPALEFAAALISADRDRTAYEAHARKARAGAKQDALLARNIKQVS